MRRLAWAAALVACGSGAGEPRAPIATTPEGSAAPRDADLLASDAVVLVDAARLREHPVGPRLDRLFDVLGGVRALRKRAGGDLDVVRDEEWMVARASSFLALEGAPLLARLGGGMEEARASARFGPVVAPEGAPLGVVRIAPREVFAPGRAGPPRLPASSAVEEARTREAVWAFVREPATQRGLGGEALWTGIADVRVALAGDGADGADASLLAHARSDADAKAFAARLAETLAALDARTIVRVATRGVLAGVRVTTEGVEVRAGVHATRAQLGAFLDLAAAASGVAMPPLGEK